MKLNRKSLKTKSAKSVCIVLSLVAGGMAGLPAYAQSPTCLTNFVSPLVVPINGPIGDILIDDACEHVYVTNQTLNRLDVFSLHTGALVNPISVGSQPAGMDTSPDGKTLYVANSGASNISVVDLTQGIETRKITVPSGFMNDTPFSLAVASNGVLFYSTTFAGSGFGGSMMQLDPNTGIATQRADFWFGGSTTERTQLKASGDRSVIGIVAGDISSGPVFKYLAASDTFTPEKDLNTFISYISLDETGAVALVNGGGFVLDANLNLLGSVPGGSAGGAVNPSGTIGYQVNGSRIDVLDLAKFTKTDSLDPGDTVANAYFYNSIGKMSLSSDGQILAVITDHGFSIVNTGFTQVIAMESMAANAAFDLGHTKPTKFEVHGSFKLGANSNDIAPLKENVTIQLGSAAITIPSGSIGSSGNGYEFTGQIGNVSLSFHLRPQAQGSYSFTARGKGIDLSGTTIPVNLVLVIGDDQGSVKLVRGEAEFSSRSSQSNYGAHL